MTIIIKINKTQFVLNIKIQFLSILYKVVYSIEIVHYNLFTIHSQQIKQFLLMVCTINKI